MKNKQSMMYFILIIASSFFGCRESVKEENKSKVLSNSVSLAQKYVIDTKESAVTWKGSNLAGSNSHTGFVYLSEGELMIENGQLTGGTAQVDMNTIEEENHDRDNHLINHLKDPDFFDVKKFPITTIVLGRAASINGENRKVTGKLTIKGITHPVTFPAKVEVKNGMVKMNGKLVIDRTKWDIRYKSGKFYALLADQTISDSIEFHIKIIAKK